jgi:hypothetical protein
MSSARQDSARKTYQKPTLKAYGGFQRLTASVSNTSTHMDNGGGTAMHKTH